MKLLIVDDSSLMIGKLKEILEGILFIKSITATSTYREAAESLENETPDVAILDIQLPDNSGIELLRYIKKDYPYIIVIMFTNQSNPYYRDYCKQLGAEFFIDKSNEFHKISSVLTSLAGK